MNERSKQKNEWTPSKSLSFWPTAVRVCSALACEKLEVRTKGSQPSNYQTVPLTRLLLNCHKKPHWKYFKQKGALLPLFRQTRHVWQKSTRQHKEESCYHQRTDPKRWEYSMMWSASCGAILPKITYTVKISVRTLSRALLTVTSLLDTVPDHTSSVNTSYSGKVVVRKVGRIHWRTALKAEKLLESRASSPFSSGIATYAYNPALGS